MGTAEGGQVDTPRLPGFGRYVICPASEHLHPHPVAAEVYPSSKKARPTAVCDCGTRVWLSAKVRLDSLLGFEDLAEAQIPVSQLAQRDEPLSEEPGRRYVPCPHSGRYHPGVHALLVKETQSAKTKIFYYTALCPGCSARVFLGERWKRGMGLTIEMVKARGMTISG